MTYARIIADSISPEGVRLTTMEVRFHRFVLAEFNTHRVFSRNSASSRAIPVRKQIERLQTEPAYPVSWPVEQKGMQGGAELNPVQRQYARDAWTKALSGVLAVVRDLTEGEVALHKSVANRLLEPHMWHTVVVTATAWENFFTLRLDADAQPEIRVAAQAMKKAYDESTPTLLTDGQWHTPYVRWGEDDYDLAILLGEGTTPDRIKEGLAKVSAARCARTSYLTHDGRRDIEEDLDLYDRLVTERVGKGKGIHWSPLEHVATPWAGNRQSMPLMFRSLDCPGEHSNTLITTGHLPRVGNLLGWRSLRTEVEAQNKARTFA